MKRPQKGGKERGKPHGPPIPDKVRRAQGMMADRHRQRKPSWNTPRRGQA